MTPQSTAQTIRTAMSGAAPQLAVLLADVAGTPVGFASYFQTYSTFLGRAGIWLDDLYVEEAARTTEDDVVRGSRGSFVGEERTRVHVRACREWPRGDVPAEYYGPVKSAAAVLMLSGELDPATPARYATEAARSLPNRRQVIRNVAHDYFDNCLRDLVAEFIARGSAREFDTRCLDTLRRPPFVTR